MKTDEIINTGTMKGSIKKVLLYAGRLILVILGIAEIVSIVWEAFEQSLSFLEISTLEIVFFMALFFVTKNYFDKSIKNRQGWKLTIFKLFKNIGWFSLMFMSTFIISNIMVFSSVSSAYSLFISYDNSIQFIEYIGIIIFIYYVTPKGVANHANIETE